MVCPPREVMLSSNSLESVSSSSPSLINKERNMKNWQEVVELSGCKVEWEDVNYAKNGEGNQRNSIQRATSVVDNDFPHDGHKETPFSAKDIPSVECSSLEFRLLIIKLQHFGVGFVNNHYISVFCIITHTPLQQRTMVTKLYQKYGKNVNQEIQTM